MKKEESFLTNLTKLYILISLHKEPKHGYRLMTEFEEGLGKKLSPGQIYPLLRAMKRDGLVSVSVEMYKRRERKVYALTASGKEQCKDLLEKLNRLIEIVPKHFLPAKR